jgi:cysteinyl-tRNA synthetase
MRVFNTLSRRLEPFEPIEPGHVRMYTCGPTVYDVAHIGNFRAYVFEDLLRRCLKYNGMRVTQVMNLTDVDDKTIRGAREAGVPLDVFTQRFKDAFFADLKTLNIEPAEHYPAATGHVPEMIRMIETLERKGIAYRSEDGSVYFSIAKFPGYGRLARLDMEGLRPGARVAQDEYEKENVGDFALWKAWDEADGDVAWPSPWGRGRPGWHIECSAMSSRYLGESFDIHTGGIDNMFPHHEDEIAQSEAASGKPFVRVWMHCAHLIVEGSKMSKSLGNFYTLRDLLDRGHSGREVRYVLMGTHYRQSLNFTFASLDAARAALQRLDEFSRRLEETAGGAGAGAEPPGWASRGRERFKAALDDDLNISEGLAAVFDMVREGHRAMDDGMQGGAARAVLELMADLDRVLGVLQRPQTQAGDEVMALLAARTEARRQRDWAEADRLRDELARQGWDVKDTPEGPRLRKREA